MSNGENLQFVSTVPGSSSSVSNLRANIESKTASGSASDGYLVNWTPKIALSASSILGLSDNRKNNREVSSFYDLMGAIYKMSNLPEIHHLHIDKDLSTRAQSLLAIIFENTSAPVPKIKNEDGEAVVFTWTTGAAKKYLTVDEEQIDMLEVGPDDECRSVDLSEEGSLDLRSLLSELKFQLTSEV